MADTQLGMARSQANSEKEDLFACLAAEQVNRLKPAFAIVCGDMIDQYPTVEFGTPVDPVKRAEQEKRFKEIMSVIDPSIPLLCICGNHELGNRPNALTIKDYVDNWGDDYFTFWCHGVKCLVANSQLWKDDTDSKEFRKAMDAWIEKELEMPDGVPQPPLLVFTHIAPFLFEQDEHEGSFNLGPEVRTPWLARAAKAGCIGWFCGHYHRNAVGKYRHDSGRAFEVVTSGAVGINFGTNPEGDRLDITGVGAPRGGGSPLDENMSGFRIVSVTPGFGVEHKWHSFTDLKAEAQAEVVAPV